MARGPASAYPTDGGWQVNFGLLLPQQPLAQMLPGRQLLCFLHRTSATQEPAAMPQTPPPPGFFAQKAPLGHPVPPSEVPPLRQKNGSVHVSVQVWWTQA